MLEKILSLPVDETLSGAVSLRRLGDLSLVVVDHPSARAAVSLQGAQLLTWQPAGQEPVLWLSERATWTTGTAIRGGVPLCWPWFGEAGSPKHGFARTSAWELTEHQETVSGVELELTLRSCPQTLTLWPHEFTSTTRITIGDRCTVGLDVRADGPSVAALHTYVRVGEPGAVTVEGLGDEFTDGLREQARGVQEGQVPLGTGEEFERYFNRPGEVATVRDELLGRTVELLHPDAGDVVVWNPGEEGARSTKDMPDEAYRDFLCVESARLGRPLTGQAGDGSRLSVTLSARRS